MEDSLVFGRLTLMLLRASVPWDSLPRDFGVVILPSTVPVSQEAAIHELGAKKTKLVVRGEVSGSNLVISLAEPSSWEFLELTETARTLGQGIREQSRPSQLEQFIRVVGPATEELVTKVTEVERWLSLIYCAECPVMTVGVPSPSDPQSVIAVLRLGHKR